MSYARYKFNKAVQSLREAGTKRREWLVSDHVFRLMRLTPADIPVELTHEFQLFQQEMTPLARASELVDSRWSAVQSVDEETVCRIIDRIMHMHQIIELKNERKSPLHQV
jgi:hypothetical protein